MGKRGGQKREKLDSSGQLLTSLSLREQASGKKQSHNSKSLQKHKHLQKLAQWTSSFGSLGAFFGRRFAQFGESLGISHDPSLFPCQRCEAILQSGSNCTVRIERNRAKKQIKSDTQNNVVYTCHFCSYRNLKRGTPKGYMRDLVPSKTSSMNPKSINSTIEKIDSSNVENERKNEAPIPATNNACSVPEISDTSRSLVKSDVKLLDSKRRKRKKPEVKEEKAVSSALRESEQPSVSSKRRKKPWTTLKDIAKSMEDDRNQRFKNFSIPFVL